MLNESRKEILDLLWEHPIEIAHWVGFNDMNDLHNEWLKSFLYADEDQTLQAHRGSYKTTTLSLFFALHAIEKPYESLLYFRKTNTDVEEIARQTVKILESGCIKYIVKVLYGVDLSLVKATGSEIQTNLATGVKGASQIVGLGIGTSITGKHADIVVTDDIVNINDRISKAERDRTKLAYQELQNIKNRGGRFINTGTPWHKEDAFTLMPNIRQYDCYETGLISDADLSKIKSSMLPSLFAANYELRHIASEDVIFTNPVTDGDPDILQQAPICHVDAAYGGEDWTAFTIAKKYDGKLYVLGKAWRKHVDNCFDEIIALRQSFNAGKIWCETNADKGYLKKEFKRLGERAATYHESMNKFVKITTYLKGIWNDVVFVKGTDKDYIQQILDFNEDAEHDDCPDSLASVARMLYSKSGEQGYIPAMY